MIIYKTFMKPFHPSNFFFPSIVVCVSYHLIDQLVGEKHIEEMQRFFFALEDTCGSGSRSPLSPSVNFILDDISLDSFASCALWFIGGFCAVHRRHFRIRYSITLWFFDFLHSHSAINHVIFISPFNFYHANLWIKSISSRTVSK